MEGGAILRIKELLHRIGAKKAKYYCVMDLTSGYHQTPVDPESIQYTAFVTSASSDVRRFPRALSKNRFMLTAGPKKKSAEVNPISRCLVVLKINWTTGNARVQSFITRSSRMNARMLRNTCLFAFSTFPLCSSRVSDGFFWYFVPKVSHTFVTISFGN